MANNKQNAQESNTNWLLIAALVVAAFFIGNLWSKVQNLENEGATQGNSQTVTVPETMVQKLPLIAEEIGLNVDEFNSCFDGKETAAKVSEDEASAQAVGITGTPGNILYDTETGNGWVLPGAYPVAMIKAFHDNLVNGTEVPADMLDGTSARFEESIALAEVTNEDWIKGNTEARVLLVEYSDYECPFCKRFHPFAEQLVKDLDGQVAWVYRHLPLDQLHKDARVLAVGTECAGKLGGNDAFWQMTDRIYSEI